MDRHFRATSTATCRHFCRYTYYIIVTDDILGDHSIYPDTKAQARKTCVRDGVYASFDQRQTGKPQLIWKNRTNTYNRLF